jgi:hypothetical protein
MEKYLLSGVLSLLSLFVQAQVSILQDKAGETSLVFNGEKTVMVNTSDASIGAGFSFAKVPAGHRERFWTCNIKFGSTEGISKLLDGYDFKPKVQASIYRGYYLKAPATATRYIFFGGGIKNSYFKLWNDKTTTDLNARNFFGYNATVGYNGLGTLRAMSYILGIAGSFGKYDNLEDLDPVDKYTIISGNDAAVLSDKKSGYTGPYYTANMFKLNIDYLLYPGILNNQFAIGTYYRGSFGGEFARSNWGAGVFLGHQEAPSNVLLGIVFQVTDIFNQLDKEQIFQKRTGISLTAGYNF